MPYLTIVTKNDRNSCSKRAFLLPALEKIEPIVKKVIRRNAVIHSSILHNTTIICPISDAEDAIVTGLSLYPWNCFATAKKD